MSRIEVSMLPVGQGAMNLIEFYDENEELINLSLIDCGGESNPGVGTVSIQKVQQLMKFKLSYNNPYIFDNVIITHLDSDHWDLFSKLFPDEFIIERDPHNIGMELLQKRNFIFEAYEMNASAPSSDECMYASCTELYNGLSRLKFVYNSIQGYKDYNIKYIDKPKDRCFRIHIHLGICLAIIVDYADSHLYISCMANDGKVYAKKSNYPEIELCEYSLDTLESISIVYDWCMKNFLTDIPDIVLNIVNDIPKILGKIYDEVHELPPVKWKCINKFYVGGITEERDKLGSGVQDFLNFAESISDSFVININSKKMTKIGKEWYITIFERYSRTNIQSVHHNSINESIRRNAASAVSVLNSTDASHKFKVFFTGDATVHTFYKIYRENDYDLIKNSIWTAPHHGSYVTMKGTVSRNRNSEELFPILLEAFKPKQIVISAGHRNSHGLPNKSFIQKAGAYFKNKIVNPVPVHGVYYNGIDGKPPEWKYCLADVPIYTLLKYVGLAPSKDNIHYSLGRWTYTTRDKICKWNTEYYKEQIPDGDIYKEEIMNEVRTSNFTIPPSPGQPRLPAEYAVPVSGRTLSEYAVPVPNRIPSRNMLFCRT